MDIFLNQVPWPFSVFRVFTPFVDVDRFHALLVTSESARTKRTIDFLVFVIQIQFSHSLTIYLKQNVWLIF